MHIYQNKGITVHLKHWIFSSYLLLKFGRKVFLLQGPPKFIIPQSFFGVSNHGSSNRYKLSILHNFFPYSFCGSKHSLNFDDKFWTSDTKLSFVFFIIQVMSLPKFCPLVISHVQLSVSYPFKNQHIPYPSSYYQS
jgi:hypothetical protein